MSDGDAVRAFVALELDSRLRAAMLELQQRLRPRLGEIRFVRPEGIHLTLRFLGQASPSQLDEVGRALAPAAAACPGFEAHASGLGTFPERGSPRVLWLGLAVPPPVEALQHACERAARNAGFEPETRPFRSHLTLGRWRERAARPELPGADLGQTRIDALVLFRSELRRDGAIYTPLARFPLAPAEAQPPC